MAVSASEPRAPDGVRSITPRITSAAGLRLLGRRTVAEAWKDRVLGLAAEAAFWQLLSLPPLMLALLGTIGYLGEWLGPADVTSVQNAILTGAAHFLTPDSVNRLVKPAVQAVLSRGRPDVVSIGFVLALWSGSTAMSDFVNTITIAYDLRDCRSAVRSRLLALGLYLGFVACGIVILPAVALGPKLIVQLAPDTYRHTVSTLVSTVYWPVVVIGSLGLLATLYHLAVPVRTTWRRALPGAVLAFGLWLLGSYLLRLYLSLVFGAESTYGSLSAPIAVLLFFYVTALAVLVGAELNAEIDKLWPSVATAQARADKKAPGRDRSSNPTSSRRAKHWRADSADGEASRTDGRR